MEKIIKLIKNSGVKYLELDVKNRETLFFEGDECRKIGIVISGRLSIVSYYSDGKEVIYNILEKGKMFGNNLIFSSEPFYRGDVVADEESKVLLIDKEEFLKAISSNQEILELFLREQSDFSKSLNLKIKLLTIDGAKERILYYLTINKNVITYKSITKLSKTLYLSREVVSRTIYKLEKEGLVEIKDKRITLK